MQIITIPRPTQQERHFQYTDAKGEFVIEWRTSRNDAYRGRRQAQNVIRNTPGPRGGAAKGVKLL